MSRLRTIAAIPAGSWTKWVVVGFWLVVLVVAYPLQSKLTGAEKNDTSSYLPSSAESVKVLDVQSRVQSPNIYSGVVVYHPVQPGEPAGVGGRLGPVRYGQPRGAVVHHHPGVDVG